MRILFFGDGPWATDSLRRLSAERWQLLGVVVRKEPSDPELIKCAEQLKLGVLHPDKVNSPEFVHMVARMKPDLNLSVSYDQILKREILRTASAGFINFHAGMLPKYRGRSVINWAIINDEKEIGLTAHYVDEGIDTGDIILQMPVPFAWADGYGDVLTKVIKAFPDFVVRTVRLMSDGKVERIPQAHLPGTYFPRRSDGDEWLDWSDTSRNLHNKVRAITRPGPGTRTLLGDKAVIVWSAFYDPSWPDYIGTPGQVVGVRLNNGVLVKTGNSTLLVQEVQIGNSEPFTPSWPIGTRLGTNLLSYLAQLQARIAGVEESLKTR